MRILLWVRHLNGYQYSSEKKCLDGTVSAPTPCGHCEKKKEKRLYCKPCYVIECDIFMLSLPLLCSASLQRKNLVPIILYFAISCVISHDVFIMP